MDEAKGGVAVTDENPPPPPRAFISYSHDTEDHKAWVLALATRLRTHGVDVILDQFGLVAGMELQRFMESGLSDSEWVVAVSTPSYIAKANERTGGAGYESQILSADLFDGGARRDHVIPVLRGNRVVPAVPEFLKGLVYIDMRDEDGFDPGYEDLLRAIHAMPAVPIPPLGSNPLVPPGEDLYVPLSMRPDRYAQPAAKGPVEFHYENNSGDLTLGSGDYTFTTHWSSAGPGQIYFYRDRHDIHSVALVAQARGFEAIGEALDHDLSSRSRTAAVGDVALFRNVNDYWLAVLIEEVTVRNAADPHSVATLRGRYRILTDRASSFGDTPGE